MTAEVAGTLADSTAASATRRTVSALLCAAVILSVHFAGRVGAYCSPIAADDSYIYASFGYRIAHGDALYRDMSDIKPPGLFMLYAMVYLIAPAGRIWIAPVESVFLLAGYYAVYLVARELFGRAPGMLSAMFAAVAINYFAVTGYAIGGFGVAENYMVLPAAAAALSYLRGLRSGRIAWFFAAGVCIGAGTCLKQTALPVVIAIVLHWTVTSIVKHRSAGSWLRGTGALFMGGCIAWLPAIVMMAVQGTPGTAISLLTADAVPMFGRSSAWPQQWRDVAPFTVPLAWSAWAAAAWIESKFRKHATSVGRPVRVGDLSLLFIWAAAEILLIANLPLRSSHYYVSACVPFVILAAAPFAVLINATACWPRSARSAAWSLAVISSAVFLRPSVDEVFPRAIAAVRNYDWKAQEHRFDEAINWGNIHFGRGEPFIGSTPSP